VPTGHFAECYTRQIGALPSARVIAPGKEQRPGHRFSDFAECNVSGTRQRGTLCRVPHIALGKEPDMGTLPGGFFAECTVSGTRQSGTLCRVPHIALGKEPDMGTLPGGFFAECPRWHSAKIDSLPSAVGQTLGKSNSFAEFLLGHSAKTPSPIAVTAVFLCRVLPGTRQRKSTQ
jgi:hypothetical protein